MSTETRSTTTKQNDGFRFVQLQDLDTEIEWRRLTKIIAPHYVTSNIGRLLVPAESMLRVYFLQLRYSMSASGVEDALYQIKVLRDFALIDIDSDVVPDASCIEAFHSLIVLHGLVEEFNDAFNVQAIRAENLA